MVTIADVLGDNVRARRKELKLTQEDLAECSGLSTTMVQQIERRECWVSTDTVRAIAAALKTTDVALFQAKPLEHTPAQCAAALNAFHNPTKSDLDEAKEKARRTLNQADPKEPTEAG
jgi:transcriptional regulator with XRE-family HTH domain